MVVQTDLTGVHKNPTEFLNRAVNSLSVGAITDIMSSLPIVDENAYTYDEDNPERGWKEGYLHWLPVGLERNNAGRIQLAGAPENPIAERTVNAIEALIEMARQLELLGAPCSPPNSPREAVRRYFDLPSLAEVAKSKQLIRGVKARAHARELARNIRVKLVRDKADRQYAVVIEDDGVGQAPEKMHSTLLSLGGSDKGDKPYLIGMFGQGGSSTFAACEYSWIVSRRHPKLLDQCSGGVGWTIVKRVSPIGRRVTYFAYLAAHPDGRVLELPASTGDALGLAHGSRFAHLNYSFGNTEPAARLYSSLNHLLFNPVLPYELYTRPEPKPDLMSGNGYRLSLDRNKLVVLDKAFRQQTIERGK
jgi:hypothetical protein